MTLREKVARALAIEDDEEFGEHSWDAYLPMADAAIAVCREHFAALADADNRHGYEPYEAVDRIVKTIRTDGK